MIEVQNKILCIKACFDHRKSGFSTLSCQYVGIKIIALNLLSFVIFYIIIKALF